MRETGTGMTTKDLMFEYLKKHAELTSNLCDRFLVLDEEANFFRPWTSHFGRCLYTMSKEVLGSH